MSSNRSTHALVIMAAADNAAALADCGAGGGPWQSCGMPRLLGPAALEYERNDAAPLLPAQRSWLEERQLDHAIVPLHNRAKQLLVADMDSTMIGQECIDELADACGVKAQVAAITERAMRGDIEFADALRERVSLLKDLPLDVVQNVMDTRITLQSGAVELVAQMKAQGAYTALVSGGFTLFTAVIAEKLGFDTHFGNELDVEAGRLTGRVKEPILRGAAKRDTLLLLCSQRGLAAADSLALGDGANDIPMMEVAGFGVGFRPKPALAAHTRANLYHADLRGVLAVQGLTAGPFAESRS